MVGLGTDYGFERVDSFSQHKSGNDWIFGWIFLQPDDSHTAHKFARILTQFRDEAEQTVSREKNIIAVDGVVTHPCVES